MMKYTKILLLLLLLSKVCFAQVKPGVRQAALSYSDLSYSKDVFSLFNNPAGLSGLTNREIGFYYSPSPFGLKELSTAYASFVEPSSIGSFSAGVMIYGFELYKETKFAFAFSKFITNDFSLGITSIYKNLSIKNYGTKWFLLFNIGGIAQLSSNINFGFLIENFTRNTVNDESNQLPIVISSGFNYKVINELNFFAALYKEIGYNISVHTGIEYNIFDFLSIRLGVKNQPNEFSSGFCFQYNIFQVEYAVNSHPDLGFTHQFGLIIQLK